MEEMAVSDIFWSRERDRVAYQAKAHVLLAAELSQPGTVTLAQSLLLLSNYHASLRRQAVSTQLQSLARTVVDGLLPLSSASMAR
jgi:hypothetical protein